MKKAGLYRRYLALLVDITILEILGLMMTPFFAFENEFPIWSKIFSSKSWDNGFSNELILWLGIFFIFNTLIWLIYFVSFLGNNGQTPGKKLLGILVKNDKGDPINYSTAFIRSFLGYSISFLTLGIGFLWALFDENNQTFHDKLAKTIVVQNS